MLACTPAERADEVIVTVDDEQAPVPTEVKLSYKVTVLPLTQETVKSGVVSDVILSVDEEPESVVAVISGAPGAASATVSIVTDKLEEDPDWFPAGSVCFVVMVWEPFERDDAVTVAGLDEQVAEPTEAAPSYKVTVAFTSQVDVKDGVLSLVILSVEDEPVSDEAMRSGAPGAAGAVVSMTNVLTERGLLGFEAASVTVIVQLECVPALRVLNVTVLLPDEAEVVADEQSPP